MATTGTIPVPPRPTPQPTRFPLAALLVLAATGFVLIGAETMPAGLLPEIASGLSTSEGTVGLLVSAYALGTVVVTVPAITLTRGFDRKPLLLVAVAGLLLTNTITAFSDSVALSLAMRFLTGAFSGVLWGMLASYGRRISPPDSAGRSLAIVSTGAPVGIAFGTPLGSWLGTTFDWRWAFGGLSVIAAAVIVLVLLVVPNLPGQAPDERKPLRAVIRIPGVGMVLAVIAVWMLGHSTAYTYIAPFLRAAGTGASVDVVLVTFGVASIAGIAITGALLDRYPRLLLHGTVVVFVASGLVLLLAHGAVFAVFAAVALWASPSEARPPRCSPRSPSRVVPTRTSPTRSCPSRSTSRSSRRGSSAPASSRLAAASRRWRCSWSSVPWRCCCTVVGRRTAFRPRPDPPAQLVRPPPPAHHHRKDSRMHAPVRLALPLLGVLALTACTSADPARSSGSPGSEGTGADAPSTPSATATTGSSAAPTVSSPPTGRRHCGLPAGPPRSTSASTATTRRHAPSSPRSPSRPPCVT